MVQWLEGIWPRDTCSMTAGGGGILDKEHGTDANWESWRVKFVAYVDLAKRGSTSGRGCRTNILYHA